MTNLSHKSRIDKEEVKNFRDFQFEYMQKKTLLKFYLNVINK